MNLDFLAWWGAVTGTIASGLATAHIIWQWRVDRAELKIEGDMSIVHTDRVYVVLTISVVNNGRRPVRIKRVAAFLTKASVPILPPGLSPEQRADLSKALLSGLTSHELCLFGGPGEGPIELSPDGGHQVWKYPLTKDVEFVTHSKGVEQCGGGYVLLTSGNKICFKFTLLHNDQWPRFNVSQNLPTSHSE